VGGARNNLTNPGDCYKGVPRYPLGHAKQLQERLGVPSTTETSSLRVIFYDEGFLKLLSADGFIIFTLAADGTPINVAIESKRDAQTIHGYFVQAMTQLGGIDVIVGDGAIAILAAAKALRQPLILVQHIHQGKGKRARITTLEPIPNRKVLCGIQNYDQKEKSLSS